MKKVRLLVSGQVQGVGFRFFTQRLANKLGLNGWVRNLPDGQVEAVFEGSEEKIKEMINWCRHGSRNAKVEKVEIIEESAKNLIGFKIK